MPIDPNGVVSALLVFAIFAMFLANSIVNRRARVRRDERRRLEAANRPPDPICGCTDHLAFHKDGGKCLAASRQAIRWERDKKLDDPEFYATLDEVDIEQLECVPVEWAIVQCPCPGYVGPEPLAKFYAPELSSEVTNAPRRALTPEDLYEADRRLLADGERLREDAENLRRDAGGSIPRDMSHITPDHIRRAARKVRGEE